MTRHTADRRPTFVLAGGVVAYVSLRRKWTCPFCRNAHGNFRLWPLPRVKRGHAVLAHLGCSDDADDALLAWAKADHKPDILRLGAVEFRHRNDLG